jgi:hypothetical protein
MLGVPSPDVPDVPNDEDPLNPDVSPDCCCESVPVLLNCFKLPVVAILSAPKGFRDEY